MNFNVYLNKIIAEEVEQMAKEMHRSRNSIISEALREWLEKHKPKQWPAGFFDFEPLHDVPNFKDYRKEFKAISEDPLQ